MCLKESVGSLADTLLCWAQNTTYGLFYLSKKVSILEMVDATRRIINGEVVVSHRLAAGFFGRNVGNKGVGRKTSATSDKVKVLSDREIDIFQRLGTGKSSKEISALLKIGARTVDTHRRHIMKKLGYRNSPEMIRHAILWTNETKN